MVIDPKIPASYLSAEFRKQYDDPGPGHRQIVAKANDGLIAPPMLRQGRFWVCPKSKVAELAAMLGIPAQKSVA
jgi:hypothetical protein